MDVFLPPYYTDFTCLASVCPDSCCKEWEIDIDDATAKFYKELPGALGEKLRTFLKDTETGTVMTINQGRCPMWQNDGLCQIHAQLGEDALCEVCKEFPRLRHDYGNFVELGLELSCPEAARLIFTEEKTQMIHQQQPGGEEPEYDVEIMKILRRTRGELLDFVDSRRYSIQETLAVALLYGYAVQNEIDGGEKAVLNPEHCLSIVSTLVKAAEPTELFAFFSKLEILTDRWKGLLQSKAVKADWNDALRSLLRYGVARYWLQAISDYDLVCRVKFILVACILVKLIGGEIVDVSQLFSKEIENNPDNVEAILDSAYSEHALTDIYLLSLLFKK